jgi:hypothetical protein
VAPVSAKIAVGAGIGAVLALVVLLAATLAGVAALLDLLNPFTGPDTTSAGPLAAVGDIPADYLTLYVAASATCPGLPWPVLAGVGKIETDHGRATLPGVHTGSNGSGAQGPMQFLRPTFDAVTARHPLPPGGATPPSPYDPHDAIYTAAAYLCDSGAYHGDLNTALFTYNHARWYVHEVLAYAHRYATQAHTQAGPRSVPGGPAHDGSTGPGGATSTTAVAVADATRPRRSYQRGDDGPVGGDGGSDQRRYRPDHPPGPPHRPAVGHPRRTTDQAGHGRAAPTRRPHILRN